MRTPLRALTFAVLVLVPVVGGLTTAGPATAAEPERYRVRAGDTLWDIARTTGVPASAIAAANDVDDPDLLVTGTVLVIPSGSAAPSPSTSSSGSASTSYVVQAGDTWWGIARRYGVRADQLASANGWTADAIIRPGQALVVPSVPAASTAPVSGSATAPQPATSGARYTVQGGDTLTRIARRYATTAAALAAANGMGLDDVVPIGASLVVPGASVAPTPTPTPTPSPLPGQQAPARLPGRIRADEDRLALVPVFGSAATEFGIPADLLMSVAYMESGWQDDVVSYKGAVGIGQLMPETAEMLAEWMDDPSLEPTDPTDNIRMSARYLRSLIDLNGGDSSAALADYYQGHASVQRRGRDQDTQRYLQVIQANRPMFA